MHASRESRISARKPAFEHLESRHLLSITVMNTLDDGVDSLRDAISRADALPGRDEIVFAASLFTSGTPVIRLQTPLSLTQPVWIHSPNGPNGEIRSVLIQMKSGYSPQEAFLIQPRLVGRGESYEVSNFIIDSFTYGIRVNDTSSFSIGTVESVNIVGNKFINNERAIFLEDAKYPFQIMDNSIKGRGAGASPNALTDAGIWITNPPLTTGTNSYAPHIENNLIVNHDDYALIVTNANIPNLTIAHNQFGSEGSTTNWPNYYGMYIYDGSTYQFQTGNVRGGMIFDNDFVNNNVGAWVELADGLTFDQNNFVHNATSGLDIWDSAVDHVVSNNTFNATGATAIRIGESITDPSYHNRITANNFYFTSGTGIPIDLGLNGLDDNDPGDVDPGPNNRLNYPEIIESGIVDEGTRWRVPVRLTSGSGKYRIEFYRYDPASFSYTFFRSETRILPSVPGVPKYEENFYVERGTEINAGQYLAALVVWEETTYGMVVNDTSELRRSTSPLSNGSTIPRVVDVLVDSLTLNGSTITRNWGRNPISFTAVVPTGKQLAPLYTQGANAIQVKFGEHVNVTVNSLKLYRTGPRGLGQAGNPNAPLDSVLTPVLPLGANGFNYNATTHVATWVFPALTVDKYRLVIAETGISDLSGNLLDGEWLNADGAVANGMVTTHTPDDFNDDQKDRIFLSGNGQGGGSFTLFFSYLPGDYNQDGSVKSSDLLSLADGNGDGQVESSGDGSTFLTPLYNQTLTMQRGMGDYNTSEAGGSNEIIDIADYLKWRLTFGSAGGSLPADGNADGVVDAADYLPFRYWENTRGAWYQGTMGAAAQIPIVDFGNAPSVANITISGSTSAHAPYSFVTHVGSGEQLRTVPVAAADTISITFSEDVNVVAENLRVFGLRMAYIPTLAQFSYDMASMTATWRFNGLPPVDHYIISLSDAVTDVEGNRLDGEWINPISLSTVNSLVSEFPSGNGTAGGNFNFVFTLLTGDANLDLQVTYADYSIWSAHYYQNGGFTIGDFDGSGQVNSADIIAWYTTYGKDLRNVQMLSDLNGDYAVNDADLEILAAHLGMSNPTHNDGDVNGDGQINTADLDLMFAQYGLALSLVS